MSFNPTIKSPHRLSKGDAVSFISPSSPAKRSKIKDAISWLENSQWKVLKGKHLFSKLSYLAGQDKHRQFDLQRAIFEKSRAIFCSRGGYGSMRLRLDMRMLQAFKKQKKIFMGMSDHTILLNTLAYKTKVSTVLGPVLAGDLWAKMSEKEKKHHMHFLTEPRQKVLKVKKDFQWIRSGQASGPLWGGNLSMILASLSTPHEVPFDGVLFFEDLHESKYKVDRMLMQLKLSGKIKKTKAVLVGQMLDQDLKPHNNQFLKTLLLNVFEKIPIAFRLKIGHTECSHLLPLGKTIEIKRNEMVIDKIVDV